MRSTRATGRRPSVCPGDMRIPRLALTIALVAPLACDSATSTDAKSQDKKATAAKDTKDAGETLEAKAPAAQPAGDTLPADTETLALDQGTSKIPLTIVVPKGCTTFNDDETTIRIDYGDGRDRGKLFGVQIAKGNEYNTNLADVEKMMVESTFSKNVIVEKTDTLLRYTMQSEGGPANHNFQMVIDIGGQKWVCKQGNNGGYDEAAVKRQIEACKSLKAK